MDDQYFLFKEYAEICTVRFTSKDVHKAYVHKIYVQGCLPQIINTKKKKTTWNNLNIQQ